MLRCVNPLIPRPRPAVTANSELTTSALSEICNWTLACRISCQAARFGNVLSLRWATQLTSEAGHATTTLSDCESGWNTHPVVPQAPPLLLSDQLQRLQRWRFRLRCGGWGWCDCPLCRRCCAGWRRRLNLRLLLALSPLPGCVCRLLRLLLARSPLPSCL